MKKSAFRFAAVAAMVCGFAAATYGGSNTKNVLNLKAKGSKSISAGKAIINGNGSYTMTTWIKLDREHMPNSTSYPNGYIFYLNDDASQRATIYYDGLTGTIKFERRNGWTIAADRISTIDAPPSGEWHYLTCVYDKEAQERRIYLDGVLKTNETDTAVCSISRNFGFAYANHGHVLRGQVAEMSIWSKALTVEEINTIMTARPVGDALDGCLAYWPFDEGDAGTSAADLAGESTLTIGSPTAQVLESTDDFPDFRVVSPRFAVTAELSYDSEQNAVTVTAVPTEPPAGTDLKAVVTAPDGSAETNTFATAVVDGAAYTIELTTLSRDTGYTITVIAVDAFDDATSAKRAIYTGEIGIVAQSAEVADYGKSGVFTVSRAATDDAVAADLAVNYTIAGTAVNGVDYKPLSGVVVIPAGANSTDILVDQMPALDFDEVRTIRLTLAPGAYAIGESADSATIAKTFYSLNHEKSVLDVTANSAALTTGQKLAPGTSFTLTGWVKLDKAAMTKGYIMGQQGNAQYVYMLYYDGTTDEIVFARRSGGWSYSANHYTRAPAPASDEWHFYTAIWDSSSMTRRLYIDGVLKAEDEGTGTTTPNVDFTMVYSSYAGCFRGGLAEVGLWNKALTEDEIMDAMWNRPEGDELADCIAYWPMDEGNAGTTARDLAASGRTLTIPDANKAKLEGTTDFVDFNAGDSRITYDVILVYPTNGVSVAVSGTEMVGRKFVEGSEATFTASTTTGKTFLRWYGDVDEKDAYNTTVTIVVDSTKALAPVYAFDWLYDAKAKTITDGYWVLNVTASGTELTVSGINAASAKDASNLNFVTLLDLRKGVADADGTVYDIVALGPGSFSGVSTLQEVRVPDTLRTIGGTWWDNGAFYNCTALTNVTPFLPPTVNYIGVCAFSGASRLTGDLVLGDKDREFTLPWANTSLAYFQNMAIRSVTTKENVRWIRSQMFNGCAQLESVILEGNVTNIEANAFAGCSAIKTFSLGHRPETWPGYQGGVAYQCLFKIDPGDEGWAVYMADPANFTAWVDLGSADKAKFRAAFPGVRKPLGLSLAVPAKQWLWSVKEPGLVILVR